MSPRTILFVHSADPRDDMGGGERSLLALMERLDPDRFRPVIAVSGAGEYQERLAAAGIGTHIVPMDPLYITVSKTHPLRLLLLVSKVIPSALRLASLIRREKAALVCTNVQGGHLYGGLAARLTRRPMVMYMRDIPQGSFSTRLFPWIARRQARRVICISNAVRAFFTDHPRHGAALAGKCVVVFNGILKTPRTIGEVDFEMPRRVTSQEQCAAWIVWHLDGFAEGGVFIPVREVEWVIEGRKSKYLLPWVIDLTAYNARPQCSVQRDWLRLALKTLSGHLAKVANESPVKLSFDGEVLLIRCAEKVVVLPGEGLPWPQDFTIPAGKLLNLPKRLMHEHIGVSIWESRLTIGHWIFSGITEETNNPSNQGNL